MTNSKTCANCKHFRLNSDGEPRGGSCHRFPPVPMLMPLQQSVIGRQGHGVAGVHPPVTVDDTCGEHTSIEKLQAVDSADATGANLNE